MSDSKVFKPGRLSGTMFTILEQPPGRIHPKSWATIPCRCDCGEVVELTYQQAYRRKHSCGCHKNSAKYEGREFKGYRTLTMLSADPVTGAWSCLCSYCGGVHEFNVGGYGIVRTLEKAMWERCIDDRMDQFIEWWEVEQLYHYFEGRMPNLRGKQEQMQWMSQFYSEKYIRRCEDGSMKYGNVAGLYGGPDKPLPPRISSVAPVASGREVVPEDPDGFGAVI